MSEWFLGKPRGKYPQSAHFIVIRRRAWPQDDSWEDAGETYYRTDYFSEWAPIDLIAEAEAARTMRELLRDALANAYHQGATDVHKDWLERHPSGALLDNYPEFGEAASDYADSIDLTTLKGTDDEG